MEEKWNVLHKDTVGEGQKFIHRMITKLSWTKGKEFTKSSNHA